MEAPNSIADWFLFMSLFVICIGALIYFGLNEEDCNE